MSARIIWNVYPSRLPFEVFRGYGGLSSTVSTRHATKRGAIKQAKKWARWYPSAYVWVAQDRPVGGER